MHDIDQALRLWTDASRQARYREAQDLDREILHQLQTDLGGAPLVLLQIVRLFIDELDRHAAQIDDAARSGELEMLARSARHMRPSAEVLGATALADLLLVLEQSAESGDAVACEALAGVFARQVERTYTVFERLVEEFDAAASAGH